MTARAKISTADALRTLAHHLGIPDEVIEDDVMAAFERDTHGGIGLIRAVRFFSDPHAAEIVEHFLNVEDPAGRRALAETCRAVAGSFGLRQAMRS